MTHSADFSPKLVERLARARRVAVLTGAGISAESGIPTFRDPGGLWQQFKPEELANVRAFLKNPVLVQGWYAHRLAIVQQSEPNPGHFALAELERLVPRFTLITQNVDGLHQRAGSRNVVELHGSLVRNHCIDCEKPATEEEMLALASGEPARCSDCTGLIRPGVVWFGESLPEEAVDEAQDAAEGAEVFLSIGTSALVYPAAGLPLLARRNGAFVAEINVEPSAIADEMDEIILGPAGVMLPDLLDRIRDIRKLTADS